MNPLDLASIHISGRNLIEASAGTGKTWTIAALYILMLLEKELRPEQILVVTYTKAATSELRERIRRRIATTLDLYESGRLPDDDELERLLMSTRRQDADRARKLLTRALYSFDDAAIFTIHGFCQRALLENAFESGSLSDSEMISDQSAIVRQVCDDFWRSRIMTESDGFTALLAEENYSPEKLVKPLEGHFQNPDLVIMPDAADPHLDHLTAERDRLFAQAKGLWQCGRSIIIRQVEDARLNQQSYKPKQIETAAASFDSWFTGGSAALQNSRLEFFSEQKIASKSTKATISLPDHAFFSVCRQLCDVTVSIKLAFRQKIISCRHDAKKWLERELSGRKRKLNQRAFDDLLLDLHHALEAESGPALAAKLRQRYGAAMIDEFQDTDPLQWNIFKAIGAEKDYPLFLIGDPKQAIYSFRGADVFAYLNAGKDVLPENAHTLGVNFRSAAGLVNAVTALFSANPDPFICTDIPFHTVGSGRSADDCLMLDGDHDEHPFRMWLYSRADETKAELKPAATAGIVRAVALETARLLEAGRATISRSGQVRPLRPGDIAVLVKSHKQAGRIQEALREIGIPSVQQGSATIFESAEALDLLRILRAAAEPHRESLIHEALLTATIGISADRIYSYVAGPGEHPDRERWLLRFRNLHSAAVSGGVVALVSTLLGSCGILTQILTRTTGERCLTNLLHCSELLHQIEREQGMNLAGLITWLERKIGSRNRDDAALLRLETDENAVMISTIHASKGLQYPVVFVPFAWDAPTVKSDRALFHNDAGDLVLDLDETDDSLQRTATEKNAEAARLLYVALTRAEFRCYAVWGNFNGAAGSPLFRLLHSRSSDIDTGNFTGCSDQAILDDVRLSPCFSGSGMLTEMMPQPAAAPGCGAAEETCIPCSCRTLSRPVRDDWHIASFSSMTSGASHAFEPRDHDPVTAGEITGVPAETDPASEFSSFIGFPAGTKAGTCLHEIFEHLDFTSTGLDSIAAVAETALAGNGFDDRWLPAVVHMVQDVTSARIIPDLPGFTLSQLKRGDWQTEMQFYLPVTLLAPESVRSLFTGLLDEKIFEEYHEVLDRLSFRQSSGMLQGFIDLVFTVNGRYYILDWKSNRLGTAASDYGRDAMHGSMSRSAYILQYHLYTLALDRLLKARLPGYSYDEHFGGAVYLYLRGISAGTEPNGVYFDRPHAGFIRRAAEIILG